MGRQSGKRDLSVIIVSYNTADLITECLDSVMADNGLDKEIFVVDNASIDGSADLVTKKFPSVNLIVNQVNRGFGSANNQALRLCSAKNIFFLNPDTRIQVNCLEKIVSYLNENPSVGLAGTKVVNPDGSLQESISYRYPGQRHATSELEGLQGAIACVLGASMITRNEMMKKIGGFDENFFLYGEDQDLCLRIRKSGYEIGYLDSVPVIHLGGQSERTSMPAEVWRKKIRAEYQFYHKHYRPRTIERIRRSQLLQASWRIATLKLTLPFARHDAKMKEKLVKYRVIFEEARKPYSAGK